MTNLCGLAKHLFVVTSNLYVIDVGVCTCRKEA